MSNTFRHHVGPRMSQAVEHNGVVYLAGQVGDDQEADVATQTIAAAMERFKNKNRERPAGPCRAGI